VLIKLFLNWLLFLTNVICVWIMVGFVTDGTPAIIGKVAV
jgi:hypothetical protein